MYATYSLEDDKIRIYSGRVERELFDRLCACRYQRAYKQGCFYAKWSPPAEDLAIELCGEISDEDTTMEERAEARSERFETYSENAQARSDAAYKGVKRITDNIPLGQPILVGHHSERGARADQKRIDRGMRKTIDERDKSAYWERRAEAAIRHAQRKQVPGVIYRRIKKLEAQLRKHQKEREPSPADLAYWVYQYRTDRLGHEYPMPDLTDEERDKMDAHIERLKAKLAARQDRWINHVEDRLAFERALYEASGGIAADNLTLEAGGFVKTVYGWKGPILHINKYKGELRSVSVPSGYSWADKVPVDGIREALTAEEAKERGYHDQER